MVLAIYQIILHLNKITECLKMTTFKIVFTLDGFFSAETTMHCKVFPQRMHYFLRVFRFLFMEHKQDYSVTSVKDVKICF
jgi:hypothetical protein